MLWAMYATAPRRCACRHDGTGWKPATQAASMHALSVRSIPSRASANWSVAVPKDFRRGAVPHLAPGAARRRCPTWPRRGPAPVLLTCVFFYLL